MIVNEMISKFVDILRESNGSLSGIIMSAPGNMKTGTLKLYAKAYNLRLATLIPSQYSFDEILGFQKLDEDDKTHTVRTKPDWYYEMIKYPDDEWILFVDEISTANPYIQGGLLNLIMSKTLGSGMDLPKKTTIVAAGNYQDNLNNEIEMNAALINRFLILNLNRVNYSDADLDVIINSSQYYDKYMSPEFTDLKEIRQFCGLESREFHDIKLVSKLMNSIKGRIQMNRTDLIKNSTEDGLIGFTSPRTLNYVKKLLTISESLGLLDKTILQIISDTIGITRISDSYIYGELERIYDSNRKSAVNVGSSYLDSRLSQVKTEDDWNELLTEIIKNQYYANIADFTSKYLTKIRETILNNYINNSELKSKLAELVRLNTKSLENGIN